MSQPPLAGHVALVTGGSRGIGRGVAVALAAAGARVYVTGRSKGALEDTARLAREAAPASGGRAAEACTAVVCDHADDADVRRCFELVCGGGGRLDVLVNNAFAGASVLSETMGQPFWEKKAGGGRHGADEDPGTFWDCINGVGLRSNYVAMVYAARIMVPRRAGLIVNISSFGGVMSIFDGVYGAGKAANDRLMFELASNLQGTGVRALTLYPTTVSTELLTDSLARLQSAGGEGGVDASPEWRQLTAMWWNAESPLYIGRVVAAIAADGDDVAARRRQGQIVIATEAGNRYGVRDAGGEQRYSGRSLKAIVLGALPRLRNSPIAALVPDLLVPWFLVRLTTGAGPSIVR
jgi:NAD(P)-dependent dehydrogenase (short-subunit alcohol dehydrogenase family)